jgi:lipopolysaccharide/colanic/teichoic acid biosynthesis glycosyltransferase
MYTNWIKPFFDFFAALIALILLSPVVGIVTLLLSIVNQGSPFFIQARPGKAGIVFQLIKFKTMNDRKDENGQLLSDEIRLTMVGKWVRKTSIDELPQLINVLKGDMSLVGPRPLLIEYLPLYSEDQSRRHDVKPGITGWAQVNGRNAISWDEKFELDVWYVDHQSFWLDLKILWMTLIKVFAAKDINAQNAATMEKFTGNA